jgi:hypothetical protein
MKKLMIIAALLPFAVMAQDSVKVTVNVQARDLEMTGNFLVSRPELETYFDSVKVKFRVPSPPTGTTTMSITVYTIDWILLMRVLKYDVDCVKAGTTGRIEALLRAVAQGYLTAALDAFDTSDTNTIVTLRIVGRRVLRRLQQ